MTRAEAERVAGPASEALALRLRAARGRVSRELVQDLATSAEGRSLLAAHLASLRSAGDESAALVACSALALLHRVEGTPFDAPGWVSRSLEDAVRSGRLVEPRRQVAFPALRERGDVWARSRSGTFVEGLDKLLGKGSRGGVGALASEEAVERELPKVGRNDPCPCGSGKKFKKCCEKGAGADEDGRPALGALLKNVRWTEELYALDPGTQLATTGEAAFREHLALLLQAERPRRAPRDDAYLDLAVISRVLQSRSAPSWARDLALALLAKGHAALDRGGLGAWLVESFPEERASLAGRLTGPFTPEGAVALGLAWLDAARTGEASGAALEVARSHPESARLAFVRALAAERLGDEALARSEVAALVLALPGPDDAVLRAAALEARAALDDALRPAPEPEDSEPAPEAPLRPVAPRIQVTVAPEPAEPVIGPRAAPLLDPELPKEVADLAAKARETRAVAEEDLHRARREHEDARAALRALERDLEKARERADHAKRAVTRAENDVAARDREGPRLELAAIQRVLEEGRDRLEEAFRESWKKGVEVAVPIVAAFSPEAMALAIPVPAKEYLEGALSAPLAIVAHATVAQVAAVARQGEQDEDSVVPTTIRGFLAVRGRAPLARYRERSELWALALDEAWSTLEIPGAPRLAPVLAPLPDATSRALLELAQPLELPPPPPLRPRPDEPDRLSVEEAAARLGLSSFALARALGSRALWESTGTVLAGTLETLRVLDHIEPRHDAPADATDHELAPDDPIAEDPHPARRALRTVLRRLVRFGKIGASHTRVDNALRGAAPHLRGTIKHAVDALVTAGVFRAKPTLNGLHISIEPVRLREIDAFIATGEYPWPKVRAIIDGP